MAWLVNYWVSLLLILSLNSLHGPAYCVAVTDQDNYEDVPQEPGVIASNTPEYVNTEGIVDRNLEKLPLQGTDGHVNDPSHGTQGPHKVSLPEEDSIKGDKHNGDEIFDDGSAASDILSRKLEDLQEYEELQVSSGSPHLSSDKTDNEVLDATAADGEEYFESSVDDSRGPDDVIVPGEMTHTKQADEGTDASSGSTEAAVGGNGGAPGVADEGQRPTAPEKEKMPLREILLRLKPASLMEDDESEISQTKRRKEKQQLILAGLAAQEELSLSDSAVPGTVLDTNSSSLLGGAERPANKTAPNKKASCQATPTDDYILHLNATSLIALVSPNPNISTRATPAPCLLVFFYSEHCRFSVSAAPVIQAMSRVLSGVMPIYAIDSVADHSINAQYSVMGTPTFVLFHNGFSVTHYNASSYTPENIAAFIKHWTDYPEELSFNVTQEDYDASPLPLEPIPHGQWTLAAAWLFLASAGTYAFVCSRTCHWIVEAVLSNWREAEAHQHQD